MESKVVSEFLRDACLKFSLEYHLHIDTFNHGGCPGVCAYLTSDTDASEHVQIYVHLRDCWECGGELAFHVFVCLELYNRKSTSCNLGHLCDPNLKQKLKKLLNTYLARLPKEE